MSRNGWLAACAARGVSRLPSSPRAPPSRRRGGGSGARGVCERHNRSAGPSRRQRVGRPQVWHCGPLHLSRQAAGHQRMRGEPDGCGLRGPARLAGLFGWHDQVCVCVCLGLCVWACVLGGGVGWGARAGRGGTLGAAAVAARLVPAPAWPPARACLSPGGTLSSSSSSPHNHPRRPGPAACVPPTAQPSRCGRRTRPRC